MIQIMKLDVEFFFIINASGLSCEWDFCSFFLFFFKLIILELIRYVDKTFPITHGEPEDGAL